jgi:hypothetical protein
MIRFFFIVLLLSLLDYLKSISVSVSVNKQLPYRIGAADTPAAPIAFIELAGS